MTVRRALRQIQVQIGRSRASSLGSRPAWLGSPIGTARLLPGDQGQCGLLTPRAAGAYSQERVPAELVDVQESNYSGPGPLPWLHGRAHGARSHLICGRTFHHLTGTRSQPILLAGDVACGISTVVLGSDGDAVGEIAYSRRAEAYPRTKDRLSEWVHGVPVVLNGTEFLLRRPRSAWSPARSARRLVIQDRLSGSTRATVELTGVRTYTLRSDNGDVATLSPRFAVRSDADEEHQVLAILLRESSAFLAASFAVLRVI